MDTQIAPTRFRNCHCTVLEEWRLVCNAAFYDLRLDQCIWSNHEVLKMISIRQGFEAIPALELGLVSSSHLEQMFDRYSQVRLWDTQETDSYMSMRSD